MANLAQIQSIAQGQFFVKDSLGNLTELKVGDTVSLNDTIVAASSNTDLSKIEILFDTNELITLSQGEQLLDTTLLASTFGNEELAFDKQEVDETLNAWNNAQDGDATDMETAAGDVTEQATNAGDERAADGGALRSKFNSRDGASTNVESDLRDISFGGGNTEEPQEQIPTELLNPVGTTTPTTPTIPVDTRVPASVITLSDPTVDEGNQITILATVTNPPQTDLIITLNNGQTITISAGQTTGNTTFTNPNSEDVYIDNSKENYKITDTTGGNYVSLDTSDSSVVTIEDTETPVTVDLTASIVNEDASDTSYVFTATLSEKSQGVTTIVTDKGTIEIADGQTTGTLKIASNQTGDVYLDASELTATISSASGGNFEQRNIGNATATAKVTDTITPIDVTITATVTTPKIIDVNTKTDGTTGVKVTGYNSDGKETNLSIIKGTNHDGFGVDGKNLSNGDTKELGKGEKIVVEFTNGKDVNSLDVSFAWRNNHETAKLTFVKDGQVVGYATVDGDGKSTTKAIVKYYDENNTLIKEVNAKGSSDKVDEAFTFELPDLNGGIVSFDKVEFSAPKSKDDYLIHEIKYKEVLDPEVTDIITDGGKVTFNIQMDENYPPQGKATATVEINGKTYNVELNATGRGTVTLDSKELGDLGNVTAEVKKVTGGNYEDVNLKTETFDFTPTLKSTDDSITTDEDVPYTLTINDFGNISESTKEFKITEVPTNGKLTLSVTTGETIVDKEGNQTTVTQDSKVEITEDKIVTLAQVKAGKVEFIPKENSDEDGSFKFQVGDGEKFSKAEYETEIIVNAVADAPDLSIELTKIESIPPKTIQVGENLNASQSNGKGGNDTSSYKVDLGESVSSVNINVSKVENGEVRLFNGSTIVGAVAITSTSASYSGNSEFTSFEVVNLAGQGKGTAAFKFDSYSVESNNTNDSYEMKISAKLTDTDDSESLSNVSLDASTFPEGAKLFDLSGNELIAVNGKYDIGLDKDGKANIKLEGPKDFDTDGIQANAISTDTPTDGSEAVSNAISFAGGGDIDLSNLENIVNLKEINLENGQKNDITDLKLDDVLALSTDNKIKITGDEIDSVTLKNEEGKTWQEGSPVTEDSKTFETYTNSGDSTVQVKVEQPISDGITN